MPAAFRQAEIHFTILRRNLIRELQDSKYSNILQCPFPQVCTYGSFSVLFCPLSKIKLTNLVLASVFSYSSQVICKFPGNRQRKTGESFQKKKWLETPRVIPEVIEEIVGILDRI